MVHLVGFTTEIHVKIITFKFIMSAVQQTEVPTKQVS